MYYVPEGTTRCGYYECESCGEKFLSLQTMEHINCPYCEAEFDPEIGPDEAMQVGEGIGGRGCREDGRITQSCHYRWKFRVDIMRAQMKQSAGFASESADRKCTFGRRHLHDSSIRTERDIL